MALGKFSSPCHRKLISAAFVLWPPSRVHHGVCGLVQDHELGQLRPEPVRYVDLVRLGRLEASSHAAGGSHRTAVAGITFLSDLDPDLDLVSLLNYLEVLLPGSLGISLGCVPHVALSGDPSRIFHTSRAGIGSAGSQVQDYQAGDGQGSECAKA